MHREDVKAAIRKRFGSLTAFEAANDLPAKSVSDTFRGRKSARVQKAIENLINVGATDALQHVDNYTACQRRSKQA